MTIFFTFVIVLAILYLMTGLKIVRQGYQYTIEHFGDSPSSRSRASIITCPSSIVSAAR